MDFLLGGPVRGPIGAPLGPFWGPGALVGLVGDEPEVSLEGGLEKRCRTCEELKVAISVATGCSLAWSRRGRSGALLTSWP